jgi:hypothetical protein
VEVVLFVLLLTIAGAGLVLGTRLGRRLRTEPISREEQRQKRWVYAAFISFWTVSFAVLAFAGITPFLILNGVMVGGLGLWTWGRALRRGQKAFRR